ncbi:MAG: dihydrodipicolinate reductase [Luteitalea sp.]|nr:dihydrodipicolinate reductase [Luteitalea sp.]
MPIRVLQVGLGPIGNAIVRQCASRRRLKIVGAVDIDAAKVGRDLADVAEIDHKLNVKVAPEIVPAIRKARPDIVVLCTSSSLEKVVPQIQAILSCRVPTVSTTEELAYPFYANRRLANRINRMATRAKVAVLGTGVNPGFTMDALPITLSGACERVDKVLVERVQDASARRLPFQQKIGAGLTEEQFQTRVDTGSVRHVGLTESVAMIAAAMGWKLDKITDVIKPKVAARPVKSPFLAVKKGQVAGIIQDGVGYRRGEPMITLHMEAYLGAPESYDAITITGVPNLYSKIAGGVPGDIATAAVTVNSIPKVIAAPPGLHTMRSLPIPSWFGD